MTTKKNKSIEKKVNDKDLLKQYEELFAQFNFLMNEGKYEWNENGDRIKKFTLYENSPTPILTNHTI